MSRYITVKSTDTLVIGGREVDAAVLEKVLSPDNRVLWAFVANDVGDIMPIAYSEDHCIWLSDKDLERTEIPG
jgi:hypothetical protein